MINFKVFYVVELNKYSTQKYVVIFLYAFKNVKNIHDINFKCPDVSIALKFKNNKLVGEVWFL